MTETWADDVAAILCDALDEHESGARVFLDGERCERESTLRDWYLSTIRGDIASEYRRRRWIVGLLHVQRGVTTALVLGTMRHARVGELLQQERRIKSPSCEDLL